MRFAFLGIGLLAVLGTFACSSSGGATSGGASSGSSGSSSGASSGGVKGPAIPAGTFLYTRRVKSDVHHLVARDLATGSERVVTDLTSDGSKGWSIDGFAISPDRTQIVMASLYGPTKEDNDTQLATNRIWLLDTEGKSWQRLTPVFKNTNLGTPGFRIDVRSPVFSKDGATVYYQYGEMVIGKSGASRTWAVPTDGSKLPDLLDTPASCSAASPPSINPATGDVVLAQDFCQDKADAGLVIFKADGQKPEMLVQGEGFGTSTVRWAADGSLFLYTFQTGGLASLNAYVLEKKQSVPLVQPPSGASIDGATLSPDGNFIVYCLRQGAFVDGTRNLHLMDLSKEPVTDTVITNDGVSCDPIF
ncbi:MAG: PD40 domain-containing protein [Deltaproteobacteria bacterium]|nr:PD40 domain-containing protein [Deltaproteobacteria bacterium]